jgi:hypothetical protein
MEWTGGGAALRFETSSSAPSIEAQLILPA